MMGKLPALLGHLGGFRRLGFLAWTADQRSLKATAAISTDPTFRGTFPRGRNLGINDFQREPILGLTTMLHPKFLFLLMGAQNKETKKHSLTTTGNLFV